MASSTVSYLIPNMVSYLVPYLVPSLVENTWYKIYSAVFSTIFLQHMVSSMVPYTRSHVFGTVGGTKGHCICIIFKINDIFSEASRPTYCGGLGGRALSGNTQQITICPSRYSLRVCRFRIQHRIATIRKPVFNKSFMAPQVHTARSKWQQEPFERPLHLISLNSVQHMGLRL